MNMLTQITATRIAAVLEGRVYPHMKASKEGFVDLGTVKACLSAIEREYDPGRYNADAREKDTFNAGWPLGNLITSDLRYKCTCKDECISAVRASIRNLKLFT